MKSVWLWALIFVSLSACEQNTHPAKRYTERLASVLKLELPDLPADTKAPKFPPTAQLELWQNKADALSIREFLSLRQCKLHQALAERNSQLGKVAPSSQLLFNDLDILNYGKPCLEKTQDKRLADKLTSYLENKEAILLHRAWHALLTQEEQRQFWRLQTAHNNYPDTLNADTVEPLTALARFVSSISNGERRFDQSDYESIEQQLGALRFGDGGQLLNEFFVLQYQLAQANRLVLQRLTSPLCLNDHTTPQAKHLQSVVNKFFIQEVQALSVKLEQRYQQLMPHYLDFEQPLLPHANDHYKQWQKQRDKVFSDGRNAAKKHVELLQKLYQQCGLVAGNQAQRRNQN